MLAIGVGIFLLDNDECGVLGYGRRSTVRVGVGVGGPVKGMSTRTIGRAIGGGTDGGLGRRCLDWASMGSLGDEEEASRAS